MSDIDNRISTIKAKVESARLTKARAEANRESAQKAYDKAMQTLEQDFGLDNLSDARDKLASLQAALEEQLNEVETLLDDLNL